MRNRGFTLVELIGVIVIISLISIIVAPLVMNQISNQKNQISNVFENIILKATREYMDEHPSSYPKDGINETSYCIALNKLIDAELLETPVVDPVTNKVYSNNNYVNVKLRRDDNDVVGEFIKAGDSIIVGNNCIGTY